MDAKIKKYLKTINPQGLQHLSKLRDLLLETFPDATEGMSYGVPSLSYDKHFIYYAAFKSHLGVYPPLTSNKKLIARTKNYRNEKGNLIFKFKDEIPYDLIIEVAHALRKQYGQ